MKYIISILIFFCISTITAIYFNWPDKPLKTENVAATINGYKLGKQRLLSSNGNIGHHNEQYEELLNSAITRELLIQEAQRQNLDKEESFRESLKIYYEESLIKILMDRQYAAPIAEVSDVEIASFKSFYGKTVVFSRLPAVDNKIQKPVDGKQPNRETVLFDDLAESMKLVLAALAPGEYAIKYDTGNEQYAIRLDEVSDSQNISSEIPDEDRIREMLRAHKQQEQIDNWLNELRNNASITIHNG